MSKVLALYHIVFCTRGRRKTIPAEHKEDLYRFLWRELKANGCVLLRIGGMPDHIHMLINLHPSISLAELMRNLKAKSSGWLGKDNRFRGFDNWSKGYFAATIGYECRDSVVEYIKNQEHHHTSLNAEDELKKLYLSAGLEYHPDDMI